jgi:hypothetical protein
MKETIRKYALECGADDVGFASAGGYASPKSPPLARALSGAKSLVVMAYRELSSCESESPQIAMNGRLDLMEFSRSVNYKLARFIERETGEKAVTVPVSYPLQMTMETMGSVGEVSLRHAALAAGLGRFGRNNLVLHPEFGCRVIFSAVATTAELPADPPLADDPCTGCDACVEACPARALDAEGKTDVAKCLRKSQPLGIGGNIRFWEEWGEADAAGRKAMLRDPKFWQLYQAGFIGFQYFCWNCMKVCPVGQ